ncbi:MAG: hypothetical protein COB20_15505 [SAR86 cluster bacterium]|uniref:CENP-V/GFA domain-containing protein n=1 Tax=SAR86 cluster bacterium TaxID=2030880 RepID=A0A2A4WUR9_9GAMM|nr:MAG: hypothetical protein COB20_15505 [SAR86 cluster bacterium]
MHAGSCLCGSVKYAVSCNLNFIVNCHCQFCRTAHGSEFVTVAMIPADKLEVLQGEELLSRFEVSNVAAFRCFCSTCGTRLFNHSPSANMISLITATLTDAVNLLPLANVNMESSNREFVQTNGLPSFDTFPSVEERNKL